MVETRRAALSLEGSVPEPELHDYLERLASRYLEENGAELVELLLAGSPNRRMIRIYVDQPGGITIDRCATFSRGIGDLLDTYDPVDGRYTLEVSSPGLNRPIKSDGGYERAIGNPVRLVVEGKGTRVGILRAFSAKGVRVKIGGEVEEIPREDVVKANLHFEI